MSFKCEEKAVELKLISMVPGTATFMCPCCGIHEDHDGMCITQHMGCVHVICRQCAEQYHSLRICRHNTEPILACRVLDTNTKCDWCGVVKKRTHILAKHHHEGESCAHVFCTKCASKLGYGHHDMCNLCNDVKCALLL
jgi:hypothetical protein